LLGNLRFTRSEALKFCAIDSTLSSTLFGVNTGLSDDFCLNFNLVGMLIRIFLSNGLYLKEVDAVASIFLLFLHHGAVDIFKAVACFNLLVVSLLDYLSLFHN